MQTHPQIDGVFAANDAMATGVVEAMAAANRKALVVGINGSKEAIDLIKAGKMHATGSSDPFMQGCLGHADHGPRAAQDAGAEGTDGDAGDHR